MSKGRKQTIPFKSLEEQLPDLTAAVHIEVVRTKRAGQHGGYGPGGIFCCPNPWNVDSQLRDLCVELVLKRTLSEQRIRIPAPYHFADRSQGSLVVVPGLHDGASG